MLEDEIKKNNLEEEDDNNFDDSEEIIESHSFIQKKQDKKYDRDSERQDKKFREKEKRKREDSSTTEGVMDLSTAKEAYKLQKMGYTKGLGGIISTGKEANVYYSKSNDLSLSKGINELAIKIFRTRTLDFKKIKQYIEGDIRFAKTGKKSHQIVQTWALKEFKNLSRAFDAGIPVPRPIIVRRNILIMEFIGEKAIAAPQLRLYSDYKDVNEVKDFYKQCIKILDQFWNKTKLVHADLSAYNLLVHNKIIYAIDIGQGVLSDHHLAPHFLYRDIKNINYYFERYEIDIDEAETVFEQITGDKAIPEFLKIM